MGPSLHADVQIPSYRKPFYGGHLRDRNGALIGDLVIADAELVRLVIEIRNCGFLHLSEI